MRETRIAIEPWSGVRRCDILKLAAQTSSLVGMRYMRRDCYPIGIKARSLNVFGKEPDWQKSIFSAHILWAKNYATMNRWNDGRTRRSPAKPFTP